MIEGFKKIFCNHKYELVRIWIDRNNQGLSTGEERVYMCKKCGKLKKINY
jgi:hypothetical protein